MIGCMDIFARDGEVPRCWDARTRPDGFVHHRFARTVDSRGSHPGPREPRSRLELAARGGGGLLLRGQRPSGGRPGGGGSPDAGGSSAGVRARPSVDARGAGEPRDPVVHRLRAGGSAAGPFEPDADPAALGGGAVERREIFRRTVRACLDAKVAKWCTWTLR